MVKVLLIGQGAREHALALKLSQSKQLSELHLWPANPAMAGLGRLWTHLHLDLGTSDFRPLIEEIKKIGIDLVVVGPEGPLSLGLADILKAQGIKVFGPSQKAAQLETDKAFAKKVMFEGRIPTATYEVSYGEDETRKKAHSILETKGGVVIKASGLAAGKGVFVCTNRESIEKALELLFHSEMKKAAETVVLEEILVGRECSFFVFLGHDNPFEIGFAVDYKRLLNGDEGPNTGGMGCYTPVPWLPKGAARRVMEEVVHPLQKTLDNHHISYTGCLYVGLMWSADKGPQVVEFNARLGDPEAQVLSFNDSRDWLPMMAACAGLEPFGTMSSEEVESSTIPREPHAQAQSTTDAQKPQVSVGVVLTTREYPYGKDRGRPGILPLSLFSSHLEPNEISCQVYGASLVACGGSVNSHAETGSGRVLTVMGKGSSFEEARSKAYGKVAEIKSIWPECSFRSDIAQKIF
jgi:phosphoribosylamine--glycine ligase